MKSGKNNRRTELLAFFSAGDLYWECVVKQHEYKSMGKKQKRDFALEKLADFLRSKGYGITKDG